MKLSERMKKTIVVVLAVTVLLCILAQHPVILGDSELPEAYRNAVQDQAGGLYSQRLPLVPTFVNVENFYEETVQYSVYYFPFGVVRMSYHLTDGYNIEKPLVGM